jgi:hypothetical protein
MGYTFTCDHCGTRYDRAPPFMGELSERFLKTADSPLTEAFSPGQTVTICRDCAEGILL